MRLEAEAAAQAKRKAEAEEQARREAQAAAAKREAEERARREAEAKARREAEEKARQAQALARLKQQQAQQQAAAAKPAIDDDATVAIGSSKPDARPPARQERKTSFLMPALIGVVLVGAGAFFLFGRKPAPEPVAQAPVVPKAETPAPAAPKAEVSAAEIEKIRRETEERIRREYADKSAAEQAAAAKVAAEKAVQDKQAALKAAAEKAALDKAAAEKASAEKAAAERALAARSSAERSAAEQAAAAKAAAEKAAAEKAVAEKAAAEKAAAEKLAAEKAAAAKTAAAKPGWPGVGDRWVYEARDANTPDRKYQIVVDTQAVTATSVRDVVAPANGTPVTLTHGAGAFLVAIAPGVASFAPYLRAFQELRGGEQWTGIEYRSLWTCGSGSVACKPTARVVGRERVTVRAGSFDAWKVVVDLGVRVDRGGGTAELTFWYAEEAKRFVKYQSRHTVASGHFPMAWIQPNIDMELLSYTPAGPR